MHFSGKIPNAILTYLELKGEDLSSFYDLAPISLEVMRDPSSWVSAPDLEYFLEKVSHQVNSQLNTLANSKVRTPNLGLTADWLTLAGHEGVDLRPWGVLDSVLRMMPRPQEVFQQPDRFLSYFISPAPPIENVIRHDSHLEFDLPLMAEQYPLVTAYLRAAIEGIPRYVGQNLAVCQWTNIHLAITWPEDSQENFLENEVHSVSPQLLQDVVEELQKSQRELEEKNRELQRKNEELIDIQKNFPSESTRPVIDASSLEGLLAHLDFAGEIPYARVHQIGQNLARLHDYMVRAQQIITILSASTKNPNALKEVIRRLDWENVKLQYPRTISESVETLRSLQKSYQEINLEVSQALVNKENLNV